MPSFEASIRLLVRSLLLLALATPAWAQSNYATPYLFTTLAGETNIGSADGTGSGARFNSPSNSVVDASGNLYIADAGNNTIRKITPAGGVTTLAGSAVHKGSANGDGPSARFNTPFGLALGVNGNLYVADSGNHAIRKITPAGVVTTLAGTAGTSGSADGTGNAARFCLPYGLAVDSTGTVYVADTGNSTIRKITPEGVVTTLAGTAGTSGNADGTGTAATFSYPFGVAVDATGNIYVADTYNYSIRKITSAGAVSTLAGSVNNYGSKDGTGSAAQFSYPYGVTVDTTGTLYVADTFNSTIRQITPAGTVTTFAGTAGVYGSSDGTGPAAEFIYPYGVYVDPAGILYVADTGNSTIRKISAAASVTTLAGLSPTATTGSSDGTGAAARFSSMEGAVVNPTGDIYVTDTDNHTIRKITPAGVVTTFAGTAGTTGSTDGPGSSATFNYPSGLAADATGNLYVADSDNHLIRKITPAGVVSTVAGTATFYYPYGICVDPTGNLFVADTGNSTIRKITPEGVVTNLAGTAGTTGSADGTGPAAQFKYPQAVVVDTSGNLYVADTGNSTIRRITPAGVVTTLAGTPSSTGSSDGIGNTALFDTPVSLTISSDGNLYVIDQGNCCIRKITQAGEVTTIAGSPGSPGSADGIGALARFYFPKAIALDVTGNLYVMSGSTIRKGVPATPPVFTTQPQSQSVTTGGSVTFSGAANGLPIPTYQWYQNGAAITSATNSSLTLSGVQASDAGDYTLAATNVLGTVTSNKATLTVTTPAPPPPPAPASSSGGGGGAIQGWFVLALLALGTTRRLTCRRLI